jgi:hypothetical protein
MTPPTGTLAVTLASGGAVATDTAGDQVLLSIAGEITVPGTVAVALSLSEVRALALDLTVRGDEIERAMSERAAEETQQR